MAASRRRVVATLVAVFLGLAGLGATTGAALGAVGAASSHDHHHDRGGPGFHRDGGDRGFGPDYGARLP